MFKARGLLFASLFWAVGDGRDILFWDDWWFGHCPLREYQWENPWREVCSCEFGNYVADYIVNGEWRKIHEVFRAKLDDLFIEFSRVHIPISPHRDKVISNRLPSGAFSVASTFKSCTDIVGLRLPWGLVWSL